MNNITQTIIDAGISYEEYHRFIASLVTNRETEAYSVDEINLTRMNIIRQDRLDKTIKVFDFAKGFIPGMERSQTWLVISEPWCEDSAQVLPVLNKLASLNDKLEFKIISREEYPSIMDAFLTDASRSIPIVIILDGDSGRVLGKWGPRPFIAQGMILKGLEQYHAMEESKEKKIFHRDLMTKLQKWYAQDKSNSIQEEFTRVLKQANALQLQSFSSGS